MSVIPAHMHVDVILNGHSFNTWSDDDPPYIIETQDSAMFKVGQDGKMYGISFADFGCVLRLRLAPHSPSTQWCIQRENERKRRLLDRVRAQSFRGTVVDTVNRVDYCLEGGAIQYLPAVTFPNQTYEATFRFERLISNIDSGAFEAVWHKS